MQYAEIFISERPWTNNRVFVGLLAEDPSSGKVKIVADPSWLERMAHSDTKPRVDDCPGIATGTRLLHKLEKLASLFNQKAGHIEVKDVLKSIPDRGTSVQISSVQSSEFGSLQDALEFCSQKEEQRQHTDNRP